MSIKLQIPDIHELKPRITVYGVGGAGGNAVNNMIDSGLEGVEFVVANTDAQALALSKAQRVVQLGVGVTEGLGAGSHPEVGRAAAEETIDEINDHLSGSHMAFITAGMGGGTGTGAAPVVARAAREQGILTVGVVTKPFQFEGARRMRLADDGIDELHRHVDTLIVIPNQNLFRVANDKTTFADAFSMADEVLFSGVACITDLMVKEGLINLDFADVRAVMRGMGKAMMGTGEAEGEDRARHAAEAAIANPLLDDVSMQGARGLLISITGGSDLTLYEVDEAASRIREEVDSDANIILGATFDDSLDGKIRVSVVATGTDAAMVQALDPVQPNADRAIHVKREIRASEPVTNATPATATEPAQIAAPTATPNPIEGLDAAMQQAVNEALEVGHAKLAEEGEVTVEPYIPTADPVRTQMDERPQVNDVEPVQTYVPQSAQRPTGPRRMPRADELPMPTREAVSQAASSSEEPRNARALFRRLASNVGLQKKEDETPNMITDDAAARSAVEASAPQRRVETPGAAGDLDRTGRPVAKEQPKKEQLEIPSFLKRHG
ncbi:cell division protein FtsZ [Maritalea sp.]|uniref:cell division protein FtsZ n=1 Tax=Maritalea sp. TaxID=2003361 RepID=UPI003EF8A63E